MPRGRFDAERSGGELLLDAIMEIGGQAQTLLARGGKFQLHIAVGAHHLLELFRAPLQDAVHHGTPAQRGQEEAARRPERVA